MTIRLRCCVPFCKRTRGPRKGDNPPITEATEWLCGPHWQAIPASLRRRRSLILRKMRRASGERLQRIHTIDGRMWKRCREAAIERAGGIA